jgi:predicted kinase
MKITILKGLPASGKSTWAKEQVLNSNGKIKRINKDDLRNMLDAGKWSKGNENLVLVTRDGLIKSYLGLGLDVIIDDTNLDFKHIKNIRGIADELGAKVEVKFFDVPVQECILRDAGRGEKSVGKKVILDMYNRYLAPKYTPPEFDPSLPDAILCDIDGTLAHNVTGRSPFDWHRVGEDEVDKAIADLVQGHYHHNIAKIILLSGRDKVCRIETEEWLQKHHIDYDFLYMRPEGNNEKDSIIKERIYREHIEGKYNVLFVLDDRQQVVDMWRSLGLKCLQVAPGDF